MRKTAFKTSALFLLVISLLCGCSPATKTDIRPSLGFTFDRRVETMYIVLMLTGNYDMLISRQETSYKRDALAHFDRYRRHPAVVISSNLIDRGFSFDYAASWICQFSQFPEFKHVYSVDYPFTDSLKNGGRTISQQSLDSFQTALISFYRETNCESFFKRQEHFAANMLSATEQSVAHENLPEVIENYYGIYKGATFTVILSPLLHTGGYEADCTHNQNKTLHLVAMIGPNGSVGNVPVFDTTFLEQDLIIHEFGHSYEFPVVEEFLSHTHTLEQKLFPPVRERVADEGCSEWSAFMHELIVRAVTLRIVEREYGKKAADELLEYERSVGFGYVEAVADELRTYEQQRDRYPTLRDFFPVILQRLGELK